MTPCATSVALRRAKDRLQESPIRIHLSSQPAVRDGDFAQLKRRVLLLLQSLFHFAFRRGCGLILAGHLLSRFKNDPVQTCLQFLQLHSGAIVNRMLVRFGQGRNLRFLLR